jgi:hypothetical protein
LITAGHRLSLYSTFIVSDGKSLMQAAESFVRYDSSPLSSSLSSSMSGVSSATRLSFLYSSSDIPAASSALYPWSSLVRVRSTSLSFF